MEIIENNQEQQNKDQNLEVEDQKINKDFDGEGFEENNDTEIVLEKVDQFNKDIEITQQEQNKKKYEMRRIPIPPHRLTPLRNSWEKIVTTIVENLKLQIRMNTKKKSVEIKTSDFTEETSALQRATDFIKAFCLGFGLNDAVALLRLDDLYIESFEIKDVKNLHGDHLSRCIGRISGEKGKTKFAIENATRTRIVLADQKVHLLGSYANIKQARDAICALILGSPPGKVYSQLRYISKRYTEKF